MTDPVWLRETLVTWYRANRRALPWREEVSPYRTLLSELMLQQTRVETVIPYFERFTARWPTLQDLAAADEDDVLEAWAGLGYYRRARSLLKACRAAAEQGGMPSEVDALLDLPGVGPYTAGAIASIAFGRPAAAVDGNVERVISRMDGLEEDPKKAVGKRAIRARVEAITADGAASDVTQGLMELGATVCTPKRWTCARCPWTERCVAHAQGRQAELPRVAKRRPPTPVRGVAALVRRGDLVLLGKRPPGLLGGLWEPIMDEIPAEAEAGDAVVEVLERRAGLPAVQATPLGALTHVFTHRRLTLEVFAVVVPPAAPVRGDGSYEDLGFLREAAPGVGLSKLASKALAARGGVLPLG